MADWYYCLNDQRCGPVDDAAVKQLIAAGTVSRTTLVWQEGMATWQPAGATALGPLFAASGPPPIASGASGIRCPFCGYEGEPLVRKSMSVGGWVLFVVLLFFCIPLCWLPFVIDGCKDEKRKCVSCGSTIG